MTDIRRAAAAAALFTVAACLLTWAAPATAQWNDNIFTNTTIAYGVESGETIVVQALREEFLYVVWPDLTAVADSTVIRAMRIDPDGARPWGADGIRLGAAAGRLSGLSASRVDYDLAVVWSDAGIGGGAVFLQRVDEYGQVLLGDGGMRACTYNSTQTSPVVANTMYGDALVGWIDVDGALNAIYANRITVGGDYVWDANGRRVGGDYGVAPGELAGTTTANGAVGLAWTLPVGDDIRIYGNSISPDGLSDTIGTICDAVGERSGLTVCNNAAGGFCTAWTDMRSGSAEVYSRFSHSSGLEQRAGGMHAEQDSPRLVSNQGGRYLVYRDNDHGAGVGRLVAQPANNVASGFTPVGLTLAASEYGVMGGFALAGRVADANVTVAYVNPSAYGAIGIQRFSRDGRLVWPEGRGAVTLRSNCGNPVLGVFDDDASAILFDSSPAYLTTTVHAQPIGPNGYTGDHRFSVLSAADRPDDQGGEVLLTWEPIIYDAGALSPVAGYSIWARDAAKSAARLDPAPGFAEFASAAPALAADKTGAGWVFVGQVPAVMADEYAAFCPTFAVSTDGVARHTEYEIVAYGADPGVVWTSANTVLGWSEDNLAPGAPLALAGEFEGGQALLSWQASGVFDEDLAAYRVYRGDAPGFPLDETTLIGSVAELSAADVLDVAQAWYRVTAVDLHGNESAGSNEVQVLNATSGVGALPAAFAHRGNFPNPFNPMTRIAFDLPSAATVQVDIYDAKGRLVRRLLDAAMPAGAHACLWDGCDDGGRGAASGVYYARVRAGDDRAVRPMTLVR
jgi:hypothetical protein